ncbi:MAG TPA: tetraacyldisaccharide 4'-kinase [Rhodanobacteraceae bacterium]|nr:tetraacyldisaccharide 4'-kinase [Rhodanobacteraceae bacterium]
MDVARRLQRVWYGGEAAPPWLSALVPVYRALRALKLAPYRLGLRRATAIGVPLIVVGNLGLGGSGKTPLVIALVEALRKRGFTPGVVSRGHGGSEAGPLRVDDSADPACVGDEPCLIRRRTGAPVAIGRDRVAAARLLTGGDVDVIVADDGLQHTALGRDVEICVIDGERRFGNGRLLPAGPLREPSARLGTVDFRVCNGGLPQPGEIPMHLVDSMAVALNDAAACVPLDDFIGRRVHALAGIGDPQRFFSALRQRRIDIVPHAFPDHHPYRPHDLAFGDDLPVLMTEKDAVKCVRFAQPGWWCVPVRAQLPEDFFDAVARRCGLAINAPRQPRESGNPG